MASKVPSPAHLHSRPGTLAGHIDPPTGKKPTVRKSLTVATRSTPALDRADFRPGMNISPTQWALQRDMKLTIHHDSPVTLPDGMRVMWTAVNRVTRSGRVLGPDQRIDPLTAIKASTLWAAWQYGEEKQKGSIETGKLADFAILSANSLKVDRMEIQDIQVLEEGTTVCE